MSFTLSLSGGPPWSLRVGNDEELRPVVTKILPGGRACVSGVRIGDHIEAVNNVPTESTTHAHNLIQDSKGKLLLTINRNPTKFHQTVAREKLSSSCQSSPSVGRRPMIPSSVPSSPIQPRTTQLFKQIRLDVQGVQGSADNKRRFFEQMGNPAHNQTTDSLLQRKIQLGYFGGVPSESTTGYGSVGGDYAGGVNSGRTSPLSSLMSGEEEEERTLHEEGLEGRILADQLRRDLGMYCNNQMEVIMPGPSQWTVKTESHGTAPAEGAIEVPGRRSVAALRQAITDKLEMKSPAPNEGRQTPSWNNVKVFEGVDEDTAKPTFGRVLEGPIAPNKYYQGVPPPSYYISSSSSVHTKPPSVPPKPPKPSVDLSNEFVREEPVRNSFLNSIAARTEEASSPAGTKNNLYYNNYYGRDDPMNNSLMSCSLISSAEQPPDPAPEDPTCTIETPIDPIRSRGSMDLESSQLLKSKSPSPYNSTSADHYATIRRVPTPVRLQVEEVPAAARKAFSYSTTTNDSGYAETLSPRDTFDAFSTNSTIPASSVDQTIDTLSLESSRPERCGASIELTDERDFRPESLLSFSTVDGEGNQKEEEIAPLRPVSNEPEMSLWYKKMFTKMHKLDPSAESVLRQQLRESSPSVSSTISRPLTPTSCVSVRPPSRFECEITPRRARSVGRVIEPADKAAWQKSRTAHFHLPSYAFRDEDSRAVLCGCGSQRGGVSCLRCGRPRKVPSWSEIDFLYKTLGMEEMKKDGIEQKLQSRVSRRAISERLDEVTAEVERFLLDLEKTNEKESSPSATQVAEEIAELKRISKEELMLRQKAERLQEELEEQRQRRHGYLPSAVPSLQKNFDRFEGLMNDYGKESSPAPSSARSRSPAPVIKTATVVYKFVTNSPRELPLNKGDVVRINRQVDSNWLEGERNGRCGIFPASYVQINNDTDNRQKMRAVYPFTARNSNEMSLKLGETVIWRRDIDQNWAEGANHIGEIGIFPKCYVRPIDEEMETPGSVIPARPKTPKITFEMDVDEDRTVTFDPVPRHNPVKQEQAVEVPIARADPVEESYSLVFPSENRSTRHPAFSEDVPVGFTNGYKEDRYRDSGRTNFVEDHRQTREQHRPEPSSGFSNNLANLIPRGSEVYRAAFAYVPQKEDELALNVDDIIFVVEKCDDGWFIGTSLRDGQFGTFPGNYVVKH